MQCQLCGVDMPDDALFCIECGTRAPVAASTGATVQLSGVAVACRSCGTANPAGARFCVRCGQPVAPVGATGTPLTPQSLARPTSAPGYRRYSRRGSSWRWGSWSGLVFPLVLCVMLLLRLPIWPGMLIIFGVVAFVVEALRGRYLSGLRGVIWLFGLAFIFMVPRLIWPGIVILIGLSVLLDLARRALHQP